MVMLLQWVKSGLGTWTYPVPVASLSLSLSLSGVFCPDLSAPTPTTTATDMAREATVD